MAHALDCEIDFDGVRVTLEGQPLGAGCLTEEEIDGEIARLKAELDRLSGEMKDLLREHQAKPPA